jgi:hypothetical protein
MSGSNCEFNVFVRISRARLLVSTAGGYDAWSKLDSTNFARILPRSHSFSKWLAYSISDLISLDCCLGSEGGGCWNRMCTKKNPHTLQELRQNTFQAWLKLFAGWHQVQESVNTCSADRGRYFQNTIWQCIKPPLHSLGYIHNRGTKSPKNMFRHSLGAIITECRNM